MIERKRVEFLAVPKSAQEYEKKRDRLIDGLKGVTPIPPTRFDVYQTKGLAKWVPRK
jgi:hypothetical protein